MPPLLNTPPCPANTPPCPANDSSDSSTVITFKCFKYLSQFHLVGALGAEPPKTDLFINDKMVEIRVCFGNNNTINIKINAHVETSVFVNMIAGILGKKEKDIVHVLLDGNHIRDWSQPIAHYIQSQECHTAHVIWKSDNISAAYRTGPSTQSRADYFEEFIDNFQRPVAVVISNPQDYITESMSHYGEPCSYCSQEMTNDPNDIIVELNSCHHVFHTSCITTWLSEVNVHCPLCNSDVRVGGSAPNAPT